MAEKKDKKKRGRKKQYTAAEIAKRRKASAKKYYARKQADKNLQTAQTEYEAAKKAYLAEVGGGTARDAYYSDKNGWEEFAESNGSDLAEYLDKYGYDDSVLDAYHDMQRTGDKSLEHVAKKLLELLNISEAAANFYIASENLSIAEQKHIEVFQKGLSYWL